MRDTFVRLAASASRVGVIGILLVTSCNFLLDLETVQCETNAECARRGANYICQQSSCVLSQTTGADATVDATPPPCASNQECIDKNAGEPFVCSKATGQCVSVRSEACPTLYPNQEVGNDNVILLGGFAVLKDVAAPMSEAIPLSFNLAIDEINRAGGIPGGSGSPRRPVELVYCDASATGAQRGVEHLALELKVPAVVGLFSQTDTARFFQDIMKPAGTFLLNPQDTTESLKSIDADQLLWHLLGTPEDVARAYRPLVERIESHVRKNVLSKPPAPPYAADIRVAVVTSESPTEQSLSTVVRDPRPGADGLGIRFNGKLALENGSNFLAMTVPSRDTDPNAEFGAKITELANWRPNIVVFLTGNELGFMLPQLEQELARRHPGEPLPMYMLAPRNARDPAVLAYLEDDAINRRFEDDKRFRFVGVQYAGAPDRTLLTSQYQLWLTRMQEKWSTNVPVTRYQAAENYYDAIYWLVYGFAAAGPGAPLTGLSFSTGVRAIANNPASQNGIIHPGPSSTISDAFLTISRADRVAFEGTLGLPDFDLASGAARSVGAAYCYLRNPTTTKIEPLYDTLRYVPTSGALDGNFGCFVLP